MAKILFNLPDPEYSVHKKKAVSLGLTTSAYIRQILKDSLNRKPKEDQTIVIKAIRQLIPVLSEALGRTQNAEPRAIEKLTQILLREYDQKGE